MMDSSIAVHLYHCFLVIVPLELNFGWTMAVTLVNFNGSVAMNTTQDVASDVIAVGHTSAVVATAVGFGVTFAHVASPV